jgi:3-phenylpropionate/trans-cinnamate dioxygenase ferredoxin reductase subunit
MQKVVVVGASLAGLRAAQALRKRGFDGRLVLVGEEPHAPYDRPPLSKQLLAGEWPAEKLFFGVREKHAELELDMRLGCKARALDVLARQVALDDGTTLDYDGLVIATGAAPRRLSNPTNLDGVYVLRTLDDALAIRAELAKQPRVLVVGAGFIGLEVAASCRKLGLSVTVVEPQPMPLLGLLGPRVAESVYRLHSDQGVRFCLGVSIAALHGTGRIERAVLSDASVIEADVVVVGIGVLPQTQWLEGSGVALADGVLCDASCATNVPDVVACGDVARWPNAWSGVSMRVEHWSNAVEQAQAAATRLLDGEAAPAYANVPYFWSDQYQVKFQCAGRVHPDDSLVVVQGQLGAGAYVALYGRGDQLTGVLACNRPAQFLRYRKLLSERVSFDAACREAELKS